MGNDDEANANDAAAGGPGHFTAAQIAGGREALADPAGGGEAYAGARALLLEIGRALAAGKKNLRIAPSRSAFLLRKLGLAASRPVTRGPQDGTRRYSLTPDGEAMFRRLTTLDLPE